jgi:hypothetical protein
MDDDEDDGLTDEQREQILETAMRAIMTFAQSDVFDLNSAPLDAAIFMLGLDPVIACGALFTLGMNAGRVLRDRVDSAGVPLEKIGLSFRLTHGGEPIDNSEDVYGTPGHRCGQIITAGAMNDEDMCHDLTHATVGQGGEFALHTFKSMLVNYHMMTVHPEAVRFGVEMIPGVSLAEFEQ